MQTTWLNRIWKCSRTSGQQTLCLLQPCAERGERTMQDGYENSTGNGNGISFTLNHNTGFNYVNTYKWTFIKSTHLKITLDFCNILLKNSWTMYYRCEDVIGLTIITKVQLGAPNRGGGGSQPRLNFGGGSEHLSTPPWFWEDFY